MIAFRTRRRAGVLTIAVAAAVAALVTTTTTASSALVASGASVRPARPPAATCLLVGGDWNQSPARKGPYSPRWIAHRAHLHITSPIRGKHGRIDFPMANVPVDHMARVRGGGSDHGLVVFRVTNPATGQWLRGGVWNVERDRGSRRRHGLRSYLTHVTAARHLDFVLLQEAKQYHRPLRHVRHFRLVAKGAPQGARQQVILVRKGVGTANPRFTRMSRHGWVVIGGRHAPAYTTFVTLDGWLRVASVHETVGVEWAHGHMRGPGDRRRARRGSAIRLVATAARLSHAIA